MSDHFGTLCIKGLNAKSNQKIHKHSKHYSKLMFTSFALGNFLMIHVCPYGKAASFTTKILVKRQKLGLCEVKIISFQHGKKCLLWSNFPIDCKKYEDKDSKPLVPFHIFFFFITIFWVKYAPVLTQFF